MGLFSALVSGSVVMIGFLISVFNPESQIGNLIKFYGGPSGYIIAELTQKVFSMYKYNSVARGILKKYIDNLDISIRENVLDISNIDNVEKFLDYNFIYSQTKIELNYKKIFINESVIDEVYNDLNNNFKLNKFSGLVLGDIGT